MSFENLGKPYNGYVKPARHIDTVFIHCDASSDPNITVNDIHGMHQERGWSGCGYHIYIDRSGEPWHGRDLSAMGAHASGYNRGSIGICLNGLDSSDFNEGQFDTLRRVCSEIDRAHGGLRFREHNDVVAKACPVFDAYKVLGLDRDGKMTRHTGNRPPPSSIPMVDVAVDLAQLGLGDEHSHVCLVQVLVTTQINSDSVVVDGFFGPRTQAAVQEFQAAEGLVADGIVGAKTWPALLDVMGD